MIEHLRRFITQYSLIIVLVSASAFVRFYNIGPSLMFQGDQGRDAMIVADIFRKLDLVFIGPVTSVGNMYLGPLYYYFMMPFLMASYPSPIGPAMGVALLGVLTTFLLFQLGKQMIGTKAAFIASFLYSFSAITVLYSRFSWNPNPAPLIGLLLVYSTWRALKNPKWWIWVGLWVAIIIQLHYLTLLAVGAAGIVWLWSLAKARREKHTLQAIAMNTGIAALICLASLTPLFLFDLKHQNLNAKAFGSLLTGNTFSTSQTAFLPKLWTYVKEIDGRSRHILFDHGLGNQQAMNRVLLLIVTGLAIWLIRFKKVSANSLALQTILIFIGTTIVGTAMYQHSVFDHYILFILPAVYLLHGVWLSTVFNHRFLQPILFAILASYLAYNLPKMPLMTVGWTMAEIAATSQTIHDRVQPNERYNIVLISESKDIDGQNYRYFLTTDKTKQPVQAEERDSTETLFIIDEIKSGADVTQLPMYEIVTFPDKTPTEIYQIPSGPQITVLRRAE